MQVLDVIILGLIAAAIGFKLFSILGEENDEDSKFKDKIEKQKQATKSKVVKLYEKRKGLVKNIEESYREGELEAHDEENLTPEQIALKPIVEKFPFFSVTKFLKGVVAAYEYILTEFAKGNKAELKPLMSKEIFKIFENAINKRKKGEVHELVFVSSPEIEITEARVLNDNKTARVKVRISSEQLDIVKDKDGNEVEDSAKSVDKIEDVWTFEKNMKDPSPDWVLVSIG